jgi:hypothetical protein
MLTLAVVANYAEAPSVARSIVFVPSEISREGKNSRRQAAGGPVEFAPMQAKGWKAMRGVALKRLLWAGAFSLTVTSGSAFAAGSAADKAAAEALFDEGLKLLKAGKYPEACSKLESSQKTDPGIGTLLYLGECYEKQGKTASAWATFREAASMAEEAGQSDRAKKGQARADRLTASLSKLTIEMAPENKGIVGLNVRREDQEVSPALFGTPVPVDPGQHVLRVTAPGYEGVEIPFTVAGNAATATVAVPPLKALPAAAPSAEPEPEKEPAPNKPVAVVASEPAAPGSTQRTLGLVVGGAGLVGLGVGGVFGILAISKNGASDCNGTTCLTEEGEAASADAKSFASIADVAFIAGGALLATGAVLYFTAPSGNEAAVTSFRLAPTSGGAAVSFGGQF